jgi:hypothetical protein
MQAAPIKRTEPCGPRCYKLCPSSSWKTSFAHSLPHSAPTTTPRCTNAHEMTPAQGKLLAPLRCLNCARMVAVQCHACTACKQAVCNDCLRMDPRVVTMVAVRQGVAIKPQQPCYANVEPELGAHELPGVLKQAYVPDGYVRMVVVVDSMYMHAEILTND